MTQPPGTPSDDWTELSQAWAQPPPDELLDAGFIRGLRRRDRLARLNFYAEAGGAVVAAAVVGWAAMRNQLPWTVSAAAAGFCLFALVATVWTRRGDPGLLLDTPEAALRSALAQARIGLRWAWAGMAISLAAVLFLGAMAAASSDRLERIGPYVAAGAIFILACVPFYWRHARRCRRRMAAHQAALEALAALSASPHPVENGPATD